MSDDFGPGILVGLVIGLLAGAVINLVTNLVMIKSHHETAAATDCAYYDPKTSEFTWGKLE